MWPLNLPLFSLLLFLSFSFFGKNMNNIPFENMKYNRPFSTTTTVPYFISSSFFFWNCKNYTHPHTQDVVGLPTISGGSGEETNEKGRESSDLFRCFFAFVLIIILMMIFFFSLSFQSQKKLDALSDFCTLGFHEKCRLFFFRHSFDVLRGWRAPTVARKEITIFPFF